MRGILECWVKQAPRIELFKKNQCNKHALHCKFHLVTGASVYKDEEYPHLQVFYRTLISIYISIVLYWRDGHCCPMHCDLFKIYCAHQNLGITRTWICRLNFAQRPVFQARGCLTSLKSQTRDPQLKVPPGGLVLRIFTSWKNPSTSAGFEPANLGYRGEYITPRPPRSTHN